MNGQDTTHIPEDLLRWELGDGRELRLARTDEFCRIGALLQEAFTAGCWVTPRYLEHLADVAGRAAVSHVWVVSDSAGLLGAVLTPKPQHHRGRQFTFNVLGVGPRGRGLQVGWALVDHSVALASALGYAGLELRSSPQMTAAHALYQRYGFVRRPEFETAVVDSGQRLFAFTYRVIDPASTTPIAYQEPEVVWAFPGHHEEEAVDITELRPIASSPPEPGEDATGALPPGARVRIDPTSLRGRATAATLTVTGRGELIDWVDDPTGDPLVVVDAVPVRADPAPLSRRVAWGTPWYPAEQAARVDVVVDQIRNDLVAGLEDAVFAEDPDTRTAALRLFYARLGRLEASLDGRLWLVGDTPSVADLELLAVLTALDLQQRAHLAPGSAAVADYPRLFELGRRLLATGTLPPEILAAVGLGGTGALLWGEPRPVEGIDDLRAAWLSPATRREALA
ncbi:GNAT family N-acetyltransferase [Tessaracoccus palaemonis]|uniref:GNAT family N-acetyltransferase n=1 Tax=Tessaracoccus palaemonis TaxID=2829499 RepID=A0ABX8SEY0_9ACTN|nr:GNAT family N-acetyltransferase [Tessaracoccus palaemonis]QXT61926.1 hypothetical protein KDB89_09000 [Tessaracoccus palaemonis]